MPKIELLQPVCLGPIEQAPIDSVVEELEYGQTIYKDISPTRRTNAVLEACDPICQLIHGYKGLPETTQVELDSFGICRNLVGPSKTSQKISRYWHEDGEDPGKHRVLLATSIPAEIVLGKIGLSKVARLHQDLKFYDSQNDYERLGVCLGMTSDELLMSFGLSIAQLLPYRAYLLGEQNYHRSPVNPMTNPIDRALLNLMFVEKPNPN